MAKGESGAGHVDASAPVAARRSLRIGCNAYVLEQGRRRAALVVRSRGWTGLGKGEPTEARLR
jgi:hypothetical protein